VTTTNMILHSFRHYDNMIGRMNFKPRPEINETYIRNFGVLCQCGKKNLNVRLQPHIAHTTIQILGKLGGRNRRLI
jgi:hypothetical protein